MTVPLEPWPDLRWLYADPSWLQEEKAPKGAGNRSFIVKDERVLRVLRKNYGRDGLCLKVFRLKFADPGNALWEGVHLAECCRVQNLFALEGLAPRVYDLIEVRDPYDSLVAQVTDYLEPEEGMPDKGGFERVMQKYGLEGLKPIHERWKMPPHNWVGNQLVDFGGLRFADSGAYEKRLRGLCRYQDHGVPYQGALGEEGMRDVAHRIEALHLDDFHFEGATVLDVGCNIGAFCREVLRRGAARAVGVDTHQARAAYELSNWMGEWRADFLELALPNQWGEIERTTGIGRFDYVLYLAVSGHVKGVHVTGRDCGVLIFEGHRHPREHYEPMLRERFAHVKYLGDTHDMGTRPVFHCRGAK